MRVFVLQRKARNKFGQDTEIVFVPIGGEILIRCIVWKEKKINSQIVKIDKQIVFTQTSSTSDFHKVFNNLIKADKKIEKNL